MASLSRQRVFSGPNRTKERDDQRAYWLCVFGEGYLLVVWSMCGCVHKEQNQKEN